MPYLIEELLSAYLVVRLAGDQNLEVVIGVHQCSVKFVIMIKAKNEKKKTLRKVFLLKERMTEKMHKDNPYKDIKLDQLACEFPELKPK